MYDHHLIAMADDLVAAGVITSKKKDKALKALQAHWENKIAIVWSAEDVVEYAKDREMEISEETACGILESMLDGHDCNYGITWDTISCELDEVEHEEIQKVQKMPLAELPLKVNELKTAGGKEMLKDRLKEGK